MVRRELVHVAVAREEQHVVALGLAAAREGAQNVVALPALELHHGHVQRVQQLLHHGELLVQGLVHRRALSLVLRQHVDSDLRLALVERADHAIGREGLHKLDEHVEEAKERVGGPSVRRRHGLADRVERAVHERVAVDDGDGPSGVVLRCGQSLCHGVSLPVVVRIDCSRTTGRQYRRGCDRTNPRHATAARRRARDLRAVASPEAPSRQSR